MDSEILEQKLRKFLLLRGAASAKECILELGISQPTFSRLVKGIGDGLVVFGRGKSCKYALRKKIESITDSLPVYAIDKDGKSTLLAELEFLSPRGVFVHSFSIQINSKLYPDLPFWLDDLRPSGFLGRLIPKKHPELNFPNDIRLWTSEVCVHYWIVLGWDLIGNLILGQRALELYFKNISSPPSLVPIEERMNYYDKLADEVLIYGAAGSSAAGEQPKFLATILETNTPVLIKFSPSGSDEIQKRRKDLLICEYLAIKVLKEFSIEVSDAELIFSDKRVFLELKRFDRLGLKGRVGIISLAALDAEFVGSGGNWRFVAKELLKKKLITPSICEQILWRYYFGLGICNTDMHLGNLSFFCEGEKIICLAPVYDMLPMLFAPVGENLIPLKQSPIVFFPEDQNIWQTAREAAYSFWNLVAKDSRLEKPLQDFAAAASEFLG